MYEIRNVGLKEERMWIQTGTCSLNGNLDCERYNIAAKQMYSDAY